MGEVPVAANEQLKKDNKKATEEHEEDRSNRLPQERTDCHGVLFTISRARHVAMLRSLQLLSRGLQYCAFAMIAPLLTQYTSWLCGNLSPEQHWMVKPHHI